MLYPLKKSNAVTDFRHINCLKLATHYLIYRKVLMKRIIVLLISMLCCKLVSAQFSDSVHYYLKYASTGAVNKTREANSYLLNNSFKVGVSRKKIALNANGGWVYGKQDHVPTNNDYVFALDFNIYKAERQLYYWGLATYDKSLSLKINDRLQTGAGVAYNFFDSKTAYLSLSDGILFEKSDLFLEDTIHDVYHTFRNSLRLSYKWVIRDVIIIDGTHFLQHSLSHGNDYNIRSNSNLSILLRKWLSITASLTYNKLSRTRRENLQINYGVTVEKYF